jgi:hypothetical protein
VRVSIYGPLFAAVLFLRFTAMARAYGGVPARRIGQSSGPVLWYVEEFDGDGNDIGPSNQVAAATINDVVRPNASIGAFYVELCVSNTSPTPVQLTFQLAAQ